MIENLKYQGKDLPVRISYSALKHTKLELKKNEDSENKDLSMESMLAGDLEVLEPLLYYSIKSAARATKSPMPFERSDMEDVLDEVWQDFLALFPRFFQKLNVGKTNQLTAKPKKTQTKKK